MNDYKPFNLDHAKAGAKIGVLIGSGTVLPARLVSTDFRKDQLVVIVTEPESRREGPYWRNENLYVFGTSGVYVPLRLVMLPIGYINDTPVYVGDRYQYAGKSQDTWFNGTIHAHWLPSTMMKYRFPEKKVSLKTWRAVIRDSRDESVSFLQGVFTSKEDCEGHCRGMGKYLAPFVFVEAQPIPES
jgi:hypothetical protein